MTTVFDPTRVNLSDVDATAVICYLNRSDNDFNGMIGARVSSIFVILITASVATFFPVVAARVSWLRINIYVYLFARYFGAGVIVATAFIHLLDPAYGSIGPASCVGMTGHWADYSWCPAIVLTSLMFVFLFDFGAEQFVKYKYGDDHGGPAIESLITYGSGARELSDVSASMTNPPRHSGDQDSAMQTQKRLIQNNRDNDSEKGSVADLAAEKGFKSQFAAFLILEFGVIFHSVTIGLNLGTTGDEFTTLYPVLVFHQAFEGLGIGARMSAIPFPKRLLWLPWALCAGYGVTTPIAIAIGLGLRNTYDAGSFTASVVSGTLDAVSAGILIYTGLVELLARDFLFNPDLTKDRNRLIYMVACVFLGIGVMALLGKWA